MKKTTFLFAFVLVGLSLFAQSKKTTSATVSFDASTPEDPVAKAENKTVIAAIDAKTGTIQFEATVKNFAFENKRVEEHFNNERRLNSDKYPKFTFKGKIDDLSKVNLTKDGTYTVNVTGDLTIKEITKEIKTPGTIKVSKGVLTATADFLVHLPDFEIAADDKKISKNAKVNVVAELK